MNNKTKTIQVERHNIGSSKTFIIAEIGSNHNNQLEYAFQSIDAAQSSGADAVKFQSLNLNKLYHSASKNLKELHKRIDLEESWHVELKNYCDRKEITFFSSPTYLEAVDLLEKINVSLYKIASAQAATFPQLIRKVATLNKPTLFSTGLLTQLELVQLIKTFQECGNEKYIILHCNSLYPTPQERVNLSLLETYSSMTNNPVGFSDHTEGIIVPLVAVARGAKVIEKHFTLDRSIPTPDAMFSLDPKAFEEMVKAIRTCEQAIGTSDRSSIEAEEAEFKEKILYRLVLLNSKKKGEGFHSCDFDFRRHPEGVDCREMDVVLKSARAASNLQRGQVLDWSQIELKDGRNG